MTLVACCLLSGRSRQKLGLIVFILITYKPHMLNCYTIKLYQDYASGMYQKFKNER